MAIGQLTRQQLYILHYTFRFYNCTNCDQLDVKLCPVGTLEERQFRFNINPYAII